MDSEELKKIFSNNLNYWLNKRGKTQADLYKRMSVSSATASDWCNAKKVPRTDKICDIAAWLMIEISDLIEIKEHLDDVQNNIIYRLKDDAHFFEIVLKLNACSQEELLKIEDYINLISNRG